MTIIFVCIVASYLIGAIPFGYVVGWLKGIDIRQHGSGNIGATNVGRVLGRSYGLLVFGLDVLKGFAPTLLASLAIARWGPSGAAYLLGVVASASGCILGHVFPIYLGFRGGKGVATSLGVLLGIYPYFTLAGVGAFLLWVALTLGSRYVSVGSVGAAVAFPIVFVVLSRWRAGSWGGADVLWPLYVFSVLIAALVVWRHRSNIRRLLNGTEPQIGRRSDRLNVEANA